MEQHNNAKLIRIKDVVKQIGIGQSTFFDWVNPKSKRYKPDFPKPVKLGRGTFYVQSEINDYLKSKQMSSCS